MAVKVLILMGSDSDYPVMAEAEKFFKEVGIEYDLKVSSAHRSPRRTEELVKSFEQDGCMVFICAAGMAAHLAGVVAASTTRPVIGVPIDASGFGGLDALLSTVQMPPGVPVATVAVGKAGAYNAAVLASQIIALADPKIQAALVANKAKMAKGVEEKDQKLQEKRKLA